MMRPPEARVAPQGCDRAGPTPGSGANRTAPSSEGEGRVKTLSSPAQGPPAGCLTSIPSLKRPLGFGECGLGVANLNRIAYFL